MKKEELIEALKMLARGRIDAAEAVADLLMPDDKTNTVDVPDALMSPEQVAKKKVK